MSKSHKKLVALGCVLAATALLPVPKLAGQAEPPRKDVLSRAEELITRFLADDGPPGVSVAIARGGETLVSGGWGVAGRERKVGATADTVYRIGSLSKQFTAAMAMRLIEHHKMALEDPIGRHLAQLPARWRGVTVLQLLNHTSGIRDFTELGARWRDRWRDVLPPDGIIALVANDPMDFAPGTKWQYSNTGYVVLAMLVEKIDGRSYARILQEDFAGPLGLSNTRACEDTPGANGQALGYMVGPKGPAVAPYRHVSHSYGAGGICSTVGDLATWNRALNDPRGGRIVSAASYAVMTTPQGAAGSGDSAFGLAATSHDGHQVISAHGAGGGFVSGNAWYPAESLSVTVLTNAMPLPQEAALLRNLGRVALGIPLTLTGAPPSAPTLDEAALRIYAGRYTIQAPKQPLGVRFWLDGRELKAQADGQAAFSLRPVGPHTFGTAKDPTIKFTFTVEHGVVTKLVFEQGGRTFDTIKER